MVDAPGTDLVIRYEGGSAGTEIRCDRTQKMPLLALLTSHAGNVTDIYIREPSLEDVFLGYTDT